MGACFSYVYGLLFGYNNPDTAYAPIPSTDIELGNPDGQSGSSSNYQGHDNGGPRSTDSQGELKAIAEPKSSTAKVQVCIILLNNLLVIIPIHIC